MNQASPAFLENVLNAVIQVIFLSLRKIFLSKKCKLRSGELIDWRILHCLLFQLHVFETLQIFSSPEPKAQR